MLNISMLWITCRKKFTNLVLLRNSNLVRCDAMLGFALIFSAKIDQSNKQWYLENIGSRELIFFAREIKYVAESKNVICLGP